MIKIDKNLVTIEERHSKYVKKKIEKNKELDNLYASVKAYISANIKTIAIGRRNELEKASIEIENAILTEIYSDTKIATTQTKSQLKDSLSVLNFLINRKKIKLINISDKAKEIFSKIKYKESIRELEKRINKFYDEHKDASGSLKDESTDSIRKLFIKEYYPEYYRFYEENNKIKEIFNYDDFNSGILIDGEIWNRHKLISQMNINVCPYCDRQYITSYSENNSNEEKVTADLDHFYPKSIYPILALSLYNFIPSCAVCNSRFKLDKDFYVSPHIYPYEESFDDCGAVFKIKATNSVDKDASIDDIIGETENFEIYIENNAEDVFKEKIENSKETFKLEAVYQSHKKYVQEILRKAHWYNETRIKMMMKEAEGLFNSEEEILLLLYGDYIVDLYNNERPLNKLTRDIFNEEMIRINKNIR